MIIANPTCLFLVEIQERVLFLTSRNLFDIRPQFQLEWFKRSRVLVVRQDLSLVAQIGSALEASQTSRQDVLIGQFHGFRHGRSGANYQIFPSKACNCMNDQRESVLQGIFFLSRILQWHSVSPLPPCLRTSRAETTAAQRLTHPFCSIHPPDSFGRAWRPNS